MSVHHFLRYKDRMKAKGIVAQVNGSAATVKIIKSSSCSGCEGCADGGKCQMSYLIGKEPESFEISAENDLNAHVGDVVEVSSENKLSLFLAAFIFVFPIAAAIAVYFISTAFLKNNEPAVLGCLSFFVFFVIFSFVANFISSKYSKNTISKIIKENGR